MQEKQKISRWVLDIAIFLIIAAYGFIFNSILSNINDNKNNINLVQHRVEELNPVFMQIQTDLSAIKINVEWLKKNSTTK